MSLASLAWVRSVQKLLGCLLIGGTLLALPSCGGGDSGKKPIATKPCTLNSDCNSGLVCSFGLCHSECKVTGDCPAGQRCITDSTDTNVCQLPVETQCNFNSDCQDPLVCAIDRQCRDQCKTDRDCLTGQVCAKDNGGVCAEPAEVTATGELKGAVDGGPDGGPSGGGSGSGGSGATGGTNSIGAGGEAGAGSTTCTDGASCVPDAAPCNAGTISCASGSPVCTDSGKPASDGTGCGKDKVCSTGQCVACKVDDACQPDAKNACAAGKMTCSDGPVCKPSGDTADGTACGTDKVCSSGACIACKDGNTCTPADPCKAGTLQCGMGPSCVAGALLKAGTSCGTGKVCDATGKCAACIQDGTCTPTSNDCHVGKYDCTNGPNCTDQNTSATDGISCGAQPAYYCSAGSCAACSNGNPCVPANACHKGTLNCGTNPPTCNDSQTAVTDGLSCGNSQSCIQGVCHTNDRTLTVTAGGGGSFVVDSSFTTVTVHLVDANNAAVAGAAITVSASSGAYGSASATTDASGNAKVSGRVGRLAGQDYTYTVSAPGATPVTFKETATAATSGNIFTIENVLHTSGPGNSPVTPIAGTVAQTYYQTYAAVSAKDGTVYFSDYCNVYQLSTLGEVTRIAGQGGTNCGTTSADGPGLTAKLYNVQALALDEGNALLYIADYSNSQVWQLDLASDTLHHFAGGGANQTPWGDGNDASTAYVSPQGLSVAPNGDVYISDAGSRIRKVDATTNGITTYRAQGTCSATQPLALYACGGYGDSCNLAWDSGGRAFIAGYFCGGGLTGQPPGIARVEADGSLTLVAGAYSGATGDGVIATAAAFPSTPAIAFDAAGNLYATVRSAHKIRRIDGLTSKITTIAGDGTPSASAASVTDYVSATTAAELNYPVGISFDSAGNLYFADTSNYSIRTVATLGKSVASTGKLATQGGTGNTVSVDAPFPVLQVKLTDAANAPISGEPIQWKRVDAGSGFVASGGSSKVAISPTGSSGLLNGVSGASGRVGLAIPGPYHFTASFNDLHGTPVTGSPQTISVSSQAPAAGTIFPVVNYAHASAHSPLPAPATFSQISYAQGVAIASDGTMYLSDDCAVYQVSPQGEMSVLAGTPGQCAYAGDGGNANGAKLNDPRSLALDEAGGLLYIADYYNYAVRVVDLGTGAIDAFAGPGSSSQASPYGDGGQATSAYIGAPGAVSVDSKGLVYIIDTYHGRIRVVDPTTGQISTWLAASTAVCNSTVTLYQLHGQSEVVLDATGGAYITGYMCGAETGNTYALGILFRSKAGAYTRIVGSNVPNTTEGALATTASLPDLGGIAVDSAGNIAVALFSNNRVRLITKSTGKISTIAGNGTGAYATPADLLSPPGDYEPASGVEVYYPFHVGYTPGNHLVIADYYNYAFREIW